MSEIGNHSCITGDILNSHIILFLFIFFSLFFPFNYFFLSIFNFFFSSFFLISTPILKGFFFLSSFLLLLKRNICFSVMAVKLSPLRLTFESQFRKETTFKPRVSHHRHHLKDTSWYVFLSFL